VGTGATETDPVMLPDTAHHTIETMRGSVFFEGPDVGRQVSRFWILLVLASVIATAGVIGDSTATVIGAMIVAPLMTPILGTMLAVVLADRANLLRSIGLVLAGAAAAIAIGYAIGLLTAYDIVAATNSQVAARVNPRLVDLLAASATGIVGSVALVRRDISDTLPGVAIAISLVPPLAVVGLTAESGAYSESGRALLLFGTNVAAILVSGIIVMAVYGVHRAVAADPFTGRQQLNRKTAVAVVVLFLIAIGVPLTASSVKIARETSTENNVRRITDDWAQGFGWEVFQVDGHRQIVKVRLLGPPPVPETAALTDALRAGGVDVSHVVLEFIPETTVTLVPTD